MALIRNAQMLVAVAAILTVSGAYAQTNYDPYNPQMERQPKPAATPSLNDLGFGTDQGNVGPFVTISDKQFAQVTAVRALMEVQLGRKALETSDRTDVKAVAQHMIDDYTKWGDGMQKAAAYLKISLPAEPDAKQKAEEDKIGTLSGAAFDKAYLSEVVHLQNEALTVTQYEAANAGVTGFRHWAGVMAPKLQDEIRMARQSLSGNGLVSKR
jgi:predicted outer membrane protein